MANKKFDGIRQTLMGEISTFLDEKGYEVLKTGSQEYAIPVVGEEREEGFVVLTFKVPSGSRDGEAYDGYAMEEAYKLKLQEKAQKAQEAAKKKAAKIEADKARRVKKEEGK